MKKQTIVMGSLLIAAAVTFWISWFLMPDPGTTDTYHILETVKQCRTEVLNSVILQITSSVLYMLALFMFARLSILRGTSFTGIALWGIGVMGMCADAFFHLLAWFMTDAAVNINDDVTRVMESMQTGGLYFLVPLMLAFFIGCALVSWSLCKKYKIFQKTVLLINAALIVGVLGVLLARLFSLEDTNQVLTPLALFSAAQALMGYELIKSAKKEHSVFHESLTRR